MIGSEVRSIAELSPLLRAHTLSPVDVVEECLARIEQGRAGNAFIAVLADDARREAARAARDIAAGRYLGPLHGVPIAVKDLVALAGVPTTSGSRLPAPIPARDAPVARTLREAGAIVVGTTNLHEFAFGTTSDETAFGPVRHPDDPARSAGGSSGGSAGALAAGMCFGAIGTDTGGSIRIPSGACGVVGLKPALGELSVEGVVPLSTTLDHVGPMARTVADTRMLFQAMTGAAIDPVPAAAPGLTFGVPRRYFLDQLEAGTRASFEAAVVALRAAGHAVQDAEIAHADWTPHVYLHIVLPEASCLHSQRLARHAELYSPGIRLRLEMGRYLLAEDYVRAMRLRDELTRSVSRALDGIDALLLPTLPIPAPPIGAPMVDVGGRQAPVRATMLRLTQLFNITGHPAMSLPAGAAPDGLPRGVQIVGRYGGTLRLLDIAAAVEQAMR